MSNSARGKSSDEYSTSKVLTLTIPADGMSKIAELASNSGKTRKQVFESALSLLFWAVDRTKEGRIIASLDEETSKYQQLSMDILKSFTPEMLTLRELQKIRDLPDNKGNPHP